MSQCGRWPGQQGGYGRGLNARMDIPHHGTLDLLQKQGEMLPPSLFPTLSPSLPLVLPLSLTHLLIHNFTHPLTPTATEPELIDQYNPYHVHVYHISLSHT